MSTDLKRKAADSETNGGAGKRAKIEDLNGLSLEELQQELRFHGLDTDGSKELLVTRLTNHLEKESNGDMDIDDDDDDSSDGEGDAPIVDPFQRRTKKEPRKDCPYLDTIQKSSLDFDFEKVCSVTLSNVNVYACLVCGKYFQGRGRTTPAYLHSLQQAHHVFIHLENFKVYCLPDDYEVLDPSLNGIKFVLNPVYEDEEIVRMDKQEHISTALDGRAYIPGLIGLNNLGKNGGLAHAAGNTDFVNVVLQALNRVRSFRRFFLKIENYSKKKPRSLLAEQTGLLIRKMWNPKNFKGQVDPHELLQVIAKDSDKKYVIGQRADPVEFLQWYLNRLHLELAAMLSRGTLKGKKLLKTPTVIHNTFQGEVEVVTIRPRKIVDSEFYQPRGDDMETLVQRMPFMMLSVDVPSRALFKEEQQKNIIPQIPLLELLKKYDGITESHNPITHERKKYRLTKLPRFLILHIKRFTKNRWFLEKNPTIVNFPTRTVDLAPFVLPSAGLKHTTYNLIANVRHDGPATEGSYSVHLQNKATEQWYNVQDLHVEETIPTLITVSEAYLQIYELQTDS